MQVWFISYSYIVYIMYKVSFVKTAGTCPKGVHGVAPAPSKYDWSYDWSNWSSQRGNYIRQKRGLKGWRQTREKKLICVKIKFCGSYFYSYSSWISVAKVENAELVWWSLNSHNTWKQIRLGKVWTVQMRDFICTFLLTTTHDEPIRASRHLWCLFLSLCSVSATGRSVNSK